MGKFFKPIQLSSKYNRDTTLTILTEKLNTVGIKDHKTILRIFDVLFEKRNNDN